MSPTQKHYCRTISTRPGAECSESCFRMFRFGHQQSQVWTTMVSNNSSNFSWLSNTATATKGAEQCFFEYPNQTKAIRIANNRQYFNKTKGVTLCEEYKSQLLHLNDENFLRFFLKETNINKYTATVFPLGLTVTVRNLWPWVPQPRTNPQLRFGSGLNRLQADGFWVWVGVGQIVKSRPTAGRHHSTRQ